MNINGRMWNGRDDSRSYVEVSSVFVYKKAFAIDIASSLTK